MLLENGWMLLASWLFFSYLSGDAYGRKMIFKLYMKYQTHYEVVASKQRFWFNSNYWHVNTILHHAVYIFLAIFIYSVVATITDLSSNGAWYVAYIALFLAIYKRSQSLEKDYLKSCSKIDTLLDASGYSLNISEFKTDVSKPRAIRKMSKSDIPSTDNQDQTPTRRTT